VKKTIILVQLFLSTIVQVQAKIDSIKLVEITVDSLIFVVYSTESDEIFERYVEYEEDMNTIKINVLYSMGWNELDRYFPIETTIKIKKDTYSKAIVSLKGRYPTGGTEEEPLYSNGYELWDTKEIDLLNITNIDNPVISNGFLIYPNPVQDIFHLNLGENKTVNLEIYGILGNLLLCKDVVSEKGIDVSFLSSGSYVVLIDRKYIAHIIKK
jgi:hypothetical protein